MKLKRTTAAALSVLWAVIRYVGEQMLVITILVGPPAAIYALITGYGKYVPVTAWVTIGALAAGLLAGMWVRRAYYIVRLSGQLREYEMYFWGRSFIKWQRTRYKQAYDPSADETKRTPQELLVYTRLRLAARLYDYTRYTSHNRWWERVIRRLPRPAVCWFVTQVSFTPLGALARVYYSRRASGRDDIAWINVDGGLDAIYNS